MGAALWSPPTHHPRDASVRVAQRTAISFDVILTSLIERRAVWNITFRIESLGKTRGDKRKPARYYITFYWIFRESWTRGNLLDFTSFNFALRSIRTITAIIRDEEKKNRRGFQRVLWPGRKTSAGPEEKWRNNFGRHTHSCRCEFKSFQSLGRAFGRTNGTHTLASETDT